MPLTAAEKQKRYRERLKEKGEYEKYQAKNKKLQARKRQNMSKSERKKLKEKNKIYKRNERNRKSDIKSSTTSAPISENILSPSEAFPSRQTYGKAKKRATSALPNSPNKRKALVFELAKKEGILTNITSSPVSSLSSSTSDALSQKVKDFYTDDRISSQAPGLKDFIICRKNGNKMRVQKRYLYLTLKETYALFCEENPDVKIGLSKFSSLRPSHILLRRDIPHNVCLCQKHENIRFLLEALKDKGFNLEPKLKDFIKTAVCDEENETCMNGDCNRCPMLDGIFTNDDLLHEPCTWKKWINTPQCQLARNEGTTQDCIQDLKSTLPIFLQHVFVKRKQSQEFKTKRDGLNSEQLILQIDFAENFSCKEQNEIQAAHWNHGQVTIFTAVSWFLEDGEKKTKSYAIVSDYLEHDKYAVNAFLREIIKDLKLITSFSSLHIFSDGAASQFKQRYNLCNLTYFCKEFEIKDVEWHFFATSHGKGAVDGIGAQIKRLAWMQVLSEKTIINSALDFYNAVKEKDIKIKVIFVKGEDISASKSELDERFRDALAIPNIQKMHHFKTVEKKHYFLQSI